VKVVVTRAREQAGELAGRLEELGHEVVVEPLIEIEPTGPQEIDVRGYDWVLVTSPNGAEELARRMRGRPDRIAAIGPGTAAALRERGLEPDLVARTPTQEGLLADLPRPAGRVLFVAAEDARTLLPDELQADVVQVYRTIELTPESFPDADLVVLASPSAARAYAALGRHAPAVTIGPETTRAAREAGVAVAAEAAPHDLDGLVEAVRKVAQ
jgi:uroporphyrinogen III methyltransferase / synthase